MIPVQERPAPSDFAAKVAQRGAAYLQRTPQPTADEWKRHAYWTDALEDLARAYGRICAYVAAWIPLTTGAATVDHFVPKSADPGLAYVWRNYRFACLTMNARKGIHEDVLDPFLVGEGWFCLDFETLRVCPSPDLTDDQREQVQRTIDRLQLSADDRLVQGRLEWLLPYCDGEVCFEFLRRRAPFIACELQRQNLVHGIRDILARRKPGSAPQT